MDFLNTFTVRPFHGLAAHLDGLLFFLLVGIAGLLRLLAKKTGNANESESEPTPPVIRPTALPPRTDQTGDEERIRKFLEALGQPPSARPPQPVKPRAARPPVTEFRPRQIEEAARAVRKRNLLSPLPPLTTVPPPEEPQRVFLPRPTAPVAAAPSDVQPITEQATPPPLPIIPRPTEVYAVATQSPSVPVLGWEGGKIFASRDDLRRAIILREVLGPPRSLQALDAAGGF
jgi:hypothetical protein